MSEVSKCYGYEYLYGNDMSCSTVTYLYCPSTIYTSFLTNLSVHVCFTFVYVHKGISCFRMSIPARVLVQNISGFDRDDRSCSPNKSPCDLASPKLLS